MNIKKIAALLLAVAMVLSFAACASATKNETEDTKPQATEPQATEPQATEPQATEPAVDVNIPEVNFFSMNYTDENGAMLSLFAYPNEEGGTYVEMVGNTIKKGNLDASAMATLSQAAVDADLASLNEMYVEDFSVGGYGELYMTYTDDTMVMGSFYGPMPDDFAVKFSAMLTAFELLTADMPEYVAAPVEMGEIADSDKTAIYEILDGMDLPAADSFGINGISVDDEYFGYSIGLSSSNGIASGIAFTPFNISTPFGLSIVTLADGTSADAVAQDFVDSLDWTKLICVQPDSALIAIKGNQVLLLTGSETLYAMTSDAIANAGWTTYETLINPNLG